MNLKTCVKGTKLRVYKFLFHYYTNYCLPYYVKDKLKIFVNRGIEGVGAGARPLDSFLFSIKLSNFRKILEKQHFSFS